MNIPFVSFEKMHNEIKDEVLAKMQEIYEKNWFIQVIKKKKIIL